MAARNILVTGATGKQGGSTLRALLDLPLPTTSPFKYIAMTRKTSSPRAQRLASNKDVSLVEGDLANPAAAFKNIQKPLWGVFLVTAVGKGEEEAGKAAVDEAIKANVKHFVFASLDRSDNTKPTYVPHFATKHNIEQYLMTRAKETGMGWTILRPVAFMENYTNNFLGKGFATMYSQLGDHKLQLVATEDIGFFAAKGFREADGWGRNRAVSIAGDDLTYAEFAAIFEQKTGRPMPSTFGFVGSFIKFAVHEMGSMFKWFAEVGCNIDIQALRKENPGLKSWGDWLEKTSDFKEEIKAHQATK